MAARRFPPGRPAEHLSDISAAPEQTLGLSFPACELGPQSWCILICLEHGTMVMTGQSFLSSIKKYAKNFILVRMYVHVYLPWLERSSQRTTYGSQLSPSIMRVSGIELRWSALSVEPYFQLLACVPRD